MSPAELRARLKAERTRMRAEARALRGAMKARLARQMEDPAFAPILERRARAKRNRRIAALVAIALLLLLLLIDCDPEPSEPVPVEEPPVVAVEDPAPDPPKKKKPRRKKPPKKKLEGDIEASDRDGMDVKPRPGPAWLPAFRLQVAARSPRLAACFNGSEEPGAMRWTTVVHARSGRVSDSEVEPVFSGVSVDNEQERCLLEVLQSPAYKLEEPDEEAVARRVSIVFEF